MLIYGKRRLVLALLLGFMLGYLSKIYLSDVSDSYDLSVIGNIADDDTFHGLWISPDIDTLTYSLAKIINRDQG